MLFRSLRESVSKQKPGTRTVYRSAMISFADTFEGLKLSEIDKTAIARWEKNARSGSGISSSTIRTYLAGLASLYRWCSEADVADIQNPVASFVIRARARQDGTALKKAAPRTRHLSESEEDRLLHASDPIPLLRAAIAIAIDTGLRKEELFGLRWRDIDLAKAQLTVPKHLAKYSKVRSVPLLQRAYGILSGMSDHAVSDFVFVRPVRGGVERYRDFSYSFEKACATAGLEDLHWHDLRRTCGCRLLQGSERSNLKPQRIEVTSKWLGHSSIAITQSTYAFLGVDNLHAEVGTKDWLPREIVRASE